MEPARRDSTSGVRRPGGRTARVNAAVRTAVIDVLSEVGYARLTMDAVATEAGVHRATLYRRWPNKEALVTDVLLSQAEEAIPMPDTGSVDDDLELLAVSIVGSLEQFGEALIRTLVGEAHRVPEMKSAARSIWEHRLGRAASIVRRAIERGQLPEDVDPDQFIEEMVAPIFFRLLVTGSTVGDDFARARVRRQLSLSRR